MQLLRVVFIANVFFSSLSGRMPWHDTHMMVIGNAVMDIAQHFVERWNVSSRKLIPRNRIATKFFSFVQMIPVH